jgi:hypothetical protein
MFMFERFEAVACKPVADLREYFQGEAREGQRMARPVEK